MQCFHVRIVARVLAEFRVFLLSQPCHGTKVAAHNSQARLCSTKHRRNIADAVSPVQTISASEAVQSARPLKSTETVNKGFVWVLFCGSASVLFAATLLVENRTPLFPAIARANRALATQRESASQAPPGGAVDTAGASGGIEARRDAEAQSTTVEAFVKGMEAARGSASQSD
jgi:hypothetical protein